MIFKRVKKLTFTFIYSAFYKKLKIHSADTFKPAQPVTNHRHTMHPAIFTKTPCPRPHRPHHLWPVSMTALAQVTNAIQAANAHHFAHQAANLNHWSQAA